MNRSRTAAAVFIAGLLSTHAFAQTESKPAVTLSNSFKLLANTVEVQVSLCMLQGINTYYSLRYGGNGPKDSPIQCAERGKADIKKSYEETRQKLPADPALVNSVKDFVAQGLAGLDASVPNFSAESERAYTTRINQVIVDIKRAAARIELDLPPDAPAATPPKTVAPTGRFSS